MAFPGVLYGKYGWEKVETSTQRHPLGTAMVFQDGRRFRYAENGGTAIGEGLLVQTEAVVANHDEDLVVATSASVGDTGISVTLGGTAAAVNIYKEGYIFINIPVSSTSPHEFYKIKSHLAIGSGGTGTINIDEEDGFHTAITAGTDTVGLIKSPYKDVIVQPTTLTGTCVGVTVNSFTADYFGWIQTAGVSVGKIDGTPAVNTLVSASTNHAGQFLAVGADTTPAYARMWGKAGVDNEFHTIVLMNLD
tara:strand:+ start:898 stop:1644 length:747 start_codon:yes stop_codon:yes gene_type:complete